MRRLIVEISVRDFNQLDPEDSALLRDIKSIEVLHFLRSDEREIALIARVEFNKPDVRIEDAFPDGFAEAQILEQEKEGRIRTYFIKARPVQPVRGEPDPTANGRVSLPTV